MKNLLYILLMYCSIISCHRQSKISDFVKSLDNGYYSIPNNINGDLILPTYENYENSNDSIFLEKVLYQKKDGECFLLIADIMGSKTTLILALQNKNSPKIIYSEQIALVDLVEEIDLKGYKFLLLNSHNADMCGEREGLTMYVLDDIRLYKSFEGIRKEEFYNVDNHLCKTGVSYTQFFKLSIINNEIVLNAQKKKEDGQSEIKKYYLKNYQFQ